MAGIAGIAAEGKRAEVEQMLARIRHRGPAGSAVVETGGATLGTVWTALQAHHGHGLQRGLATDFVTDSHFASAEAHDGRLSLERDALGVAPLYYGHTPEGDLCFASEIKAMLAVTTHVHEFPPGCRLEGGVLQRRFQLAEQPPLAERDPQRIASELRRRLELALDRRLGNQILGSWLSGGLDSSALAALVRPRVLALHTFVTGLAGAPDLEASRIVAAYLQTIHHEIIVTLNDLIEVLPAVIQKLESFDALLVRSSVSNYMAAREASRYVSAVISGEGGDELFGGYAYLERLAPADLPAELVDITGRLHNTAFQRVDRSASAHGTVAHVPFSDREVLDYALRIPAEYKRRDGIEKWILRRAMDGLLPRRILERRKSKFWEGAGVGDLLARYAEERITDSDFRRERVLPLGWLINSKEELMYYRIFHEYFGAASGFQWMGRTKGAPRQSTRQANLFP